MIIRSAREEDLPVCEELVGIDELRYANGTYATAAMLAEYLDEDFFLVAEIDGRVIGCVYGEELRVHGVALWMLVVHPDHRGNGIGKELVEAFCSSAKKREKAWCFLLGLDSAKHERLYTSSGFVRGKRLYEYMKDLTK